MSAIVLSLEHFLNRIEAEGEIAPITWLIGAGISASSGLPVASGISKRIILFEYCIAHKLNLWKTDSKIVKYQLDLSDYLDWYNEQEIAVNNSTFNNYLKDSILWLKKEKPQFVDISEDSPEAYQLVFKTFIQSAVLHQNFLSSIVSRTKGVNLAHLCLAGFLRDHGKEWGRTVFTTNFDDLLLQALLTINYTARIFGDIEATHQPRPDIKPRYPQIVHLHGRHTGYRLLNREEDIKNIDPFFQSSFENHIKESDLIVLGYSGWDDVAMTTLKCWIKDSRLLLGNLYWIPYKDESTILKTTRDFLDNCPAGKAYIIVDHERPMDADYFMLKFVSAINNKGFTPYRKEIIDRATEQHKFILKQLSYYTEFDPNQSLKYLKEAKAKIKLNDLDQVRYYLEEAEKLTDSKDLPKELLGEVYLELGIIYMELGQLSVSEIHLTNAEQIWNSLKAYDDEDGIGMQNKGNALRALGELHIKKGNLDYAYSLIKRANERYLKLGNSTEKSSGLGYASILFSIIALRKGQIELSKRELYYTEIHFTEANDQYGLLLYFKCKADALYVDNAEINIVLNYYKKALELAKILGADIKEADILKSIGNAYLKIHKIQKATQSYNEAEEIYKQKQSVIGLANISSARGDLSMRNGDEHKAMEYYLSAIEIYKSIGATYSQINVLCDILKLHIRIESEEQLCIDIINKIKELDPKGNNSYAKQILKHDKLKF